MKAVLKFRGPSIETKLLDKVVNYRTSDSCLIIKYIEDETVYQLILPYEQVVFFNCEQVDGTY